MFRAKQIVDIKDFQKPKCQTNNQAKFKDSLVYKQKNESSILTD